MKKVKISCGGYSFEGILEEKKAPETCAAFLKLLPLHEKVIHVRWSGEAFWIPYGDRHAKIPYENNTSHPGKGEALWYPGGPSEAEIIFAYGSCCFSSKIGQLSGNHFLSVKDNLDDWYELGRKILIDGRQDLTIELIPDSV